MDDVWPTSRNTKNYLLSYISKKELNKRLEKPKEKMFFLGYWKISKETQPHSYSSSKKPLRPKA